MENVIRYDRNLINAQLQETTQFDEIRLSVALVTRNRPESLERCLKSWRSQTVAPFEIVVSDDSDENFAPKIEELAKQFNCVYTRGPRRGLYANRNHASLTCRGTHILSADDDHTHPQDYVERILEVVDSEPNRVWIFAERNPKFPDTPLICPPELHRSGGGCMPKDPSNCAAIADGSSVYPQEIFDRGLRYDETYFFGSMWYLWGKVLVKKGWRISFSDATFVWHHCETDGREYDPNWLRRQIECNTYISFVYSWWLAPSVRNSLWPFVYLLRRMMWKDSLIGYKVSVRLGVSAAFRLLSRAWSSRSLYNAC